MKKTNFFIYFLAIITFVMNILLLSCGGSSSNNGTVTYTLTVNTNGNGTVTISPDKTAYSAGEAVILTAVPDSNNCFYSWSGGYTGFFETTAEITMNSNQSVTADFKYGNAYFVKTGSFGDGSFADPWGNISTAINNAAVPAAVFVAAGLYEDDKAVNLKEGISLYGGFNSDFSDRKYETAADRGNASYLTEVHNYTSSGTCYVISGDGSTTPITQKTVIEGFTITGGDQNNNYAVYCSQNSSPVIQYNTITGGSSDNSYGIRCSGSSPLIQYNEILGGENSSYSYGIYIASLSSEMIIQYNTITGGRSNTNGGYGIFIYSSPDYLTVSKNTITGGINCANGAGGIFEDTASGSRFSSNIICAGYTGNLGNSYGIITGSASDIINNVISGGDGDISYGIRTNSSGYAQIRNNTINGGDATTTAYAVYLNGYTGYIQNNIIFTLGGTNRYGIYEVDSTTSSPHGLNNNNIFDCSTALYRDADGSGNLTAIADVNDWNNTTGSSSYFSTGNISIDMINNSGNYYFTDWEGADNNADTLLDNDWTLTSDAPVNIRGGALDLSSLFTVDYSGTARTTSIPTGMTNGDASGWSMGAYERD